MNNASMRAVLTETIVVHINVARLSKLESAPFTRVCYWTLELVFWNRSLKIVIEFSQQTKIRIAKGGLNTKY